MNWLEITIEIEGNLAVIFKYILFRKNGIQARLKVKDLWKLNLIRSGQGLVSSQILLQVRLSSCPSRGTVWVILGHYLTVSKWRPDLRPSEDDISTTSVWVRFHKVSVESFTIY